MIRQEVGPVCEQSLSRLENALALAVRRLRALRSDNADLRRENVKLKDSLEELERENRDRRSKMDRYEEERLRVRKRVERAIGRVAVVEETLAPPAARAHSGSDGK